MNKTLLIIICDFLLISVLALVEFKPTVEEALIDTQSIRDDAAEEMLELLQLSLEHENAQRKEIEDLLGDTNNQLDETRDELDMTQEELASTLDNLEDTQDSLQDANETIEKTNQEKSELEDNLLNTRTTLEVTRQEVNRLESSLDLTEQQRMKLQSELQDQQQVVAQREAELEQARDNLADLETTRQQMSTELRILDTEKQMLQQNLITAQAEVERARIEAEKARSRSEDLAAGVTELAATSSALKEEIKEEIRQAQPLSLNAIYQQFEQNRVFIRFEWEERIAFSTRKGQSALQTVLVDNGIGIFAIFAVENSPLSSERARNPKMFIKIGNQSMQMFEVGYLSGEKRVAAIQVPKETAWASGLKIFSLDTDPMRFSNAVLIKDDQQMYGEIPVRVPPGEPGFFDVETKLFNRLFGEFSPSTGDFVFSMTGELSGLMIGKDRAKILQNPTFVDFNRLDK